MTPKKKYISRSLERHVKAPRTETWDVLLGELEPAKPPLIETVLSFEPPWRRVYEVEGETGLDLYQGTFMIRDDGPECHLIWGVVINPEPNSQGTEFFEMAIGVMEGFLDRVAEAAESQTEN